jgi:hypothetical protein
MLMLAVSDPVAGCAMYSERAKVIQATRDALFGINVEQQKKQLDY